MFLIEYSEGTYINAEVIEHVTLVGEHIKFSVVGDLTTSYAVSEELSDMFVNHLQAINQNITNIDVAYRKRQELIDVD